MSADLHLQSVSKRYPRALQDAVHQVSLTVPPGEILGVVGASGSGKTTLLRMIAGLETPSQGEISIGGQLAATPTRVVPPEKRGVGLVFQEGALFPHMNVVRNVSYGLHRHLKHQRLGIAEQMLALVGLSHKRHNYPHELSGGERQRIALARALAPDPKVILLDEPFSNLDPSLRTYLRDQLLEIVRRVGTTALVVTHDVMDALVIADRLAVFREGRLVQCASSEQIYHHPADAYCARLFGPASPAPRAWRGQSWLGDRTWIRPQELELHTQSQEGALRVRVNAVRFEGEHLGFLVRPITDTEGEEQLLVHLPLHQRERHPLNAERWLVFRRAAPEEG